MLVDAPSLICFWRAFPNMYSICYVDMVEWPPMVSDITSKRHIQNNTTPVYSCIIGSFGARTMLLQTLRRSTIEFTPNVQALPTKQGCCGESDMKVLFFLLWPLTQAIRVAVRVKRLRMNSTSHSHVHCATVKRIQRLRDHSLC